MSDAEKPEDPSSDPDPQPGDFNAELDGVKPEQIEIHDGDPAAKLTMSSCTALNGAFKVGTAWR